MIDYIWAHNKIKLQRAFKQLEDEKKVNSSLEINEETVKARYIKLLGLVLTQDEIQTMEVPTVVKAKPIVRRPVRPVRK